MTDTLNLLPCPFCGPMQEEGLKPYICPVQTPWMSKHYAASCDNCGAATCIFTTEEKAAEAWNTRNS